MTKGDLEEGSERTLKTIQRRERSAKRTARRPREGRSGERSAEVRNHELNAGTVQESGGFGEPKGVEQRNGRGLNIRV